MNDHCYVFIGPSGSGKTTLAAALFAASQKVVSHTTRLPRRGEQAGRDYFFVSPATFETMILQEQLAEYDSYHDAYYGVSRQELTAKLGQGDCYDVLTLNGFLNLEKNYGAAVIIPVLLQISQSEAAKRLAKRGEKKLQQRLTSFAKEVAGYSVLSSRKQLIRIDANGTLTAMQESFEQQVQQLDL